MAKAYSYARFSHPDQAKGDSLRRQIERGKDFARKHNLTLTPLVADMGKSAFHADHLKSGSLGKFIKLIEEGIVEKGDWLIVESLDRISRQDPLKAFSLFTQIITSGVILCTVADGMIYTEEKVNENASLLFVSLGVMIRANEESKTKSMRIKENWSRVIKQAKEEFVQIPGKVPAWIDFENKKYVINKQKKKTLLLIHQKAVEEKRGPVWITKFLNQNKIPPISRQQKGKSYNWSVSTVKHFLTTKNLIGEYQPKIMENGKPVIRCEPIKNYYPAVISEERYYEIQAVMKSRALTTRGRPSKNVSNLFGRILKNGFDGSSMVLSQKKKDKVHIVSSQAVKGLTDYKKSFPYNDFENCFLNWVKEVNLKEVKDKKKNSKLDELQNQLIEAKAEQELYKNHKQKTSSILELLSEADSKVETLKAKIEDERSKSKTKVLTNAEIREVIDELKEAEDKNEVRLRLRAAIAGLIERIDVYIYSHSMTRLCLAHVLFHDGTDRTFAVRTERGKDTTTYSDDIRWKKHDPKPFFERVAEEMLEAPLNEKRLYGMDAKSLLPSDYTFSKVKH